MAEFYHLIVSLSQKIYIKVARMVNLKLVFMD